MSGLTALVAAVLGVGVIGLGSMGVVFGILRGGPLGTLAAAAGIMAAPAGGFLFVAAMGGHLP